jgi:AcrR family transcriptional regulator
MTKKQRHIVETAKGLFLKHGVKRITIREICQKAGVSKVTFYRYYTNKDDLVRYIRDSLLQEGFSHFDRIIQPDLGFAEKVDRMTEWRREFFSTMSSDFIEDVLSMDDIMDKVKERFFRMMETGQRKGDIRKEISPELVWMVSEKMNELVTQGKWRSVASDYSEYQAQMRLLFFHGLLTNNKDKENQP